MYELARSIVFVVSREPGGGQERSRRRVAFLKGRSHRLTSQASSSHHASDPVLHKARCLEVDSLEFEESTPRTFSDFVLLEVSSFLVLLYSLQIAV